MLNQTGSSKADIIVKLVLLFFVSLLFFSVGAFVGKQVSDSDYKRAALEEDYKSFRDTGHGQAANEHNDEKVTEEEIASLTEEFVQTEQTTHDTHGNQTEHHDSKREVASTNEHGENKEAGHDEKFDGYKKFGKGVPSKEFVNRDHEKKMASHTNGHGNTENSHELASTEESHNTPAAKVSKHAQRISNGMSPLESEKESRQPTSVLPQLVASDTIGKYTVQVASYATEDEAKAHAAELRKQSWNAFYLPAQVNSKTWYRVSVGLFPNSKSANQFKDDLLKHSSIPSAIIQKIVK